MKKRTVDLMTYYRAMHARRGDLHWWPADGRLEMIVGAMLTQNTAWGNVLRALANLRGAGLLPERRGQGVEGSRGQEEEGCARRMHALGPAGLAPLIRPAGYFNVKGRRLWNLLDWLVGKYGGRFARMESVSTSQLREELLAVNGVGPETADSILLYALHREMFVIDTYTHRVFKRHGLAPEDATYEDLQKLAMGNLPRDVALWNEYHAQLVMVGKEFCKPTPRCEQCPLRGLLPRGRRELATNEHQ